MDKMKCILDTRHLTLDTRGFRRPAMLFLVSLAVFCTTFSGCATTSKPAVAPMDDKFRAVAVDVYQNPESRSAAKKILGVDAPPQVIKYSPVTGKHYSGDLEFDPETGAKLEVIKE